MDIEKNTPAHQNTEGITNTTGRTFTDKNSRYEEIIDHMNKCCLCGSELAFHHETDYITLTVREEAHCDSCGIRTKKESYTIQ